MPTTYQKLVRDRIPEIIAAAGETPVTRVLEPDEYLRELVRKLAEETAEFAAGHSVEELADVLEVVEAIRSAIGIDAAALEAVRRRKAASNGRFEGRVYLVEVR